MAQDPFEAFRPRPAHLGNRRIVPPEIAVTEELPTKRFNVQEWLRSRTIWIVGGVLALFFLILLFFWQNVVTLRGLEFTNTKHADLTELRKLIPYTDGQIKLSEVASDSVALWAKSHPWVKDASVSKGLNGTVEVEIIEKQPVLLVLNRDGVPQYYLDELGYPMNWKRGASFDVLPVSGATPPYRPGTKVPNGTLLALADALAKLPPNVTALVASLTLRPDGRIVGRTASINQSIPAKIELGKSNFKERLHTLKAFWDQSVLPYPQKEVREIDLRWEGQVVTKEQNEQK
ncbi:MAG: hypothetical protein J0L94_12915 [Rhodothermia bacterium]|nr:hypothetical protein [Rhodothermia bacterium]